MMIKRWIYNDLRAHLRLKEISLIIGPRQVGKTTLMLLLEEELRRAGEKTLFLNLDREMDRRYFRSQEELERKIRLEIGREAGYVFIDEVQRKENAGLFLKGLYDSGHAHKFIVSGSGSLELKEKIHESLVGRKRVFELRPVSFFEFVDFRTYYRYSSHLFDFFEVEKERSLLFLNEYMNFGGYPRVILAEEEREKSDVIGEIFTGYLEKDISYLLRVARVDAFSDLMRIIAAQIGRLVNHSRLSGELNISIQTLKNYLWYAEKTFVIERLSPYFKNVRKEIVKAPVYYFYDIGLRNYGAGCFGNLVDFSPAFENIVFNILKKKISRGGGHLHFWRTKDKVEVDFVLDAGGEIAPVEVKYRSFKEPKVERSLRSFIKRYTPAKAYVVNLDYRDEISIGPTRVIFMPYWALGERLI